MSPSPSPPGPPADLGRRAVRGTSVTLAAQGVRFGLQLVSLTVLTRLLSPSDFGLVAMAVSIIGVADILRDFGLNSAAIQASTLSRDERSNLFWANTVLGLAAAGLAVAVAPLIVLLYGDPRLTAVVTATSAMFVLNGAATQFRADLSRSLRFSALAVADVAGQLVALTAAILTALAGWGYWAIVVQLNTVAAATLVLSWWQSRFVPSPPRREVSIRRFFRYGGGMLGTQLIAYGTRNIDNVAIGAWSGQAALGYYSRGYQLVMMPLNQINAPLTTIALPILSRVHQDPQLYPRYLHRAQLVGCYVTAPLLAMAAGLADPLVRVLFGPGWEPVGPIFAALAVGGVFRAVAQIAYWVFLAEGLTGTQFRMYVLTRPIVIAVMLSGLPWGALGVAVTASVAYVLDWLVQMWWVARVSRAPAGRLLRTAVLAIAGVGLPAGGAAVALASWLEGSGAPAALQLLLGVPAGLAAIGLAAAVLPWVRRDLALIWGLGSSGLRRRRAGPASADSTAQSAPPREAVEDVGNDR
ncbi:MAG: lipopolysaccharide biosynthesis protein [Kineosporiaceae bacterium]|nr:lipopolysaccharide biosynthesis protein [Kineosporiaceae bacterium]